MDPSIRRAALRAAQKTALVLSLSGCALSHERAPRSPTPVADAGRPVDAAVLVLVADGGTDAPALADAPTECDGYLAGLALHEWWCGGFADEAAVLSPRTTACCTEHEAAVAAGTIAVTDLELERACCNALAAAGVPSMLGDRDCGCLAWGPPVPPEMLHDEVASAGAPGTDPKEVA